MKKLTLLFAALFIGFCALGQNTVTLEAGTTGFTPQFRYKAIIPDSLNHWWLYNPLTAKYNRIFTGTESNLLYTPITGSANYIQNGTSLQTGNFNISGIGKSVGGFSTTDGTYTTSIYPQGINIDNGVIVYNGTGNGLNFYWSTPTHYYNSDNSYQYLLSTQGTNLYILNNDNNAHVAFTPDGGITTTGNIILPNTTPTNPLQAIPKKYVDSLFAPIYDAGKIDTLTDSTKFATYNGKRNVMLNDTLIGSGSLFTKLPKGTAIKNGGTIFASNSPDSLWFRGYAGSIKAQWFGAKGDTTTNDNTALQRAIYAAQNGTLIAGQMPGYLISGLKVKSNTTIEWGLNSKIKLANGSNNYMLRNDSFTTAFSNIKVSGGRWFGNWSNQTPFTDGTTVVNNAYTNGTAEGTFNGFGMFFYSSVGGAGLEISNFYVQDCQLWMVGIINVNNVKLHDFEGEQPVTGSGNFGGFQGWGSNWEIYNGHGRASDDFIAIGAYGAPVGNASAPNFLYGTANYNNIRINNIRFSDGTTYIGPASSGVSIYSGNGITGSGIVINNLSGTLKSAISNIKGIGTIGAGVITDLAYNNINVNNNTGTTALKFALGNLTINYLSFNNWSSSETVANTSPFRLDGANTFINNLILSDLNIYEYSSTGSAGLGTNVALININSNTSGINNITYNRVKYLLGNTTSATVLYRTTNGVTTVPHIIANGLQLTTNATDNFVLGSSSLISLNTTEVPITKAKLSPILGDRILDRTTTTFQTWNGSAWVNDATTAAPTSAQIPIGQSTGVFTPETLSGDATIGATGVVTLKSTGTAGTYGQVTTDAQGRVSAGTIIADVSHGGTAQSTYSTGDILYASATNTLSKRAIGSTNNVLTVVGGVPTWVAPANSGTVTSVTSANTDISIANTTTTPVLTLNRLAYPFSSFTAIGTGDILQYNGTNWTNAVNTVSAPLARSGGNTSLDTTSTGVATRSYLNQYAKLNAAANSFTGNIISAGNILSNGISSSVNVQNSDILYTDKTSGNATILQFATPTASLRSILFPNLSGTVVLLPTGTPTIVVGSGAGTGATASIVGNNQDVIVTITTGAALNTNEICTITLGGFSFANSCIPNVTVDANSTILPTAVYMRTLSTTNTIKLAPSAVLAPASIYIFNVHIGGY